MKSMTLTEPFAYGFRKTGQKSETILIPRDCLEPDNFLQFMGYTLLKEQYVALEEFCSQYNMTPEEMFSEPDSLEVENGLVTIINSAGKNICNSDKKLFVPKQLEYLQELNCSNGGLIEIIGLPARLQEFSCGKNLLGGLPELPQQLLELYCYDNPLGKLPELPSQLQILKCSKNQLAFLPILPLQLSELSCWNNQLTVLPELPQYLQILDCSGNQLTSFPELPQRLQKLCCWENKLCVLPELPQYLQKLFCGDNLLTVLPKLPQQLQLLYCDNNPFLVLVAPKEVSSLRQVHCQNTKISQKTIKQLQKQGVEVIYS